MIRVFAPLFLLVPCCLAGLFSGPVRAQDGDMFPTKSAALQRGKQLKCAGASQMGDQWMPCKDYESYEKAIKNVK